jgi:hypothetical protein
MVLVAGGSQRAVTFLGFGKLIHLTYPEAPRKFAIGKK